jgi:hypothetical protein
MKENDEDVVHAGIVSKSQKIPEFRPILEFATDKPKSLSGAQAYRHPSSVIVICMHCHRTPRPESNGTNLGFGRRVHRHSASGC